MSCHLPSHQVIRTYLGIRGVSPSRIERTTEGMAIDLGNGANGVGQVEHCLRPLTSKDPWKQVGNRTVVHAGFKDWLHIEYSGMRYEREFDGRTSSTRIPLNRSPLNQSHKTPLIITADPYRPTTKSAGAPRQARAKFCHLIISLLPLSKRFLEIFTLTHFGLCSIISGLRPFYSTPLFLSSDISFMTHRTIFPQPDRSCHLLVYDLT